MNLKFYKTILIITFTLMTLILSSTENTNAEDQAENNQVQTENNLQNSPTTISSLKEIIQSIDSLKKELTEKEILYKNAKSEEKKKAIMVEINELEALIDSREKEFLTIATGEDPDEFEPKQVKTFKIQEEFQEIIKPVVEELKNITKHPRDLEKLRRQINYYEKKLPVIKILLANIDKLINSTGDPAIIKKLTAIKASWDNKEKEYARQLTKLQYQFDQKKNSKQSYIKMFQINIANFFKSRGLNLIISVGLFILVIILFRFIQRRLSLIVKENETKTFYHRFAKVFFHAFSFISALSVSILFLYNMGDWVLLSIILILVAGILWSARQGIAGYWEQVRLLLDIGPVRQGERVIYNGIPWQVLSLNMMTTLKNPLLQGGLIRLPLKSILPLQSRPFHPEEYWFPTRVEDYTLLNDGTWGKVLVQTPETVTMEVLGGCRKVYPVESFLQQNPVNQSINNFGVSTIFGLDYDHQALITGTIPLKLEEIVLSELKKEEYGEHLIKVIVQFKEAGASSLDLLVYVTFNSKAAGSFYAIGRAVQKIMINACTQNNWGIPFDQLTLHMKDSKKEID